MEQDKTVNEVAQPVKYSVGEVAELLEVSYTTALNMIKSKKLYANQFGGRWYVLQEEINRFNREGNHPQSME